MAAPDTCSSNMHAHIYMHSAVNTAPHLLIELSGCEIKQYVSTSHCVIIGLHHSAGQWLQKAIYFKSHWHVITANVLQQKQQQTEQVAATIQKSWFQN